MITYFSENTGLTNVFAFYSASQFVLLREVSPGHYEGDLEPGTPAGAYTLRIKEGAVATAYAEYYWDGEAEIDLTALMAIAANAAIARKFLTNKTLSIPAEAKFITYDDDNTTPLIESQTFNAEGQPSIVKPVRREKL